MYIVCKAVFSSIASREHNIAIELHVGSIYMENLSVMLKISSGRRTITVGDTQWTCSMKIG